MATPGNPFDTKDLDQIRTEQRRLMRHLDHRSSETAMEGVRDLEVPKLTDRDLLEDPFGAIDRSPTPGAVAEFDSCCRGVLSFSVPATGPI